MRALALNSLLPVELKADLPPDRLQPAVETTAYFIVAESLANAAKHAEAGRITISMKRAGDRLVLEVVDDGKGGADLSGSGLRGLADRVAALGGSLEIASPPGGGTVVRADLPCG